MFTTNITSCILCYYNSQYLMEIFSIILNFLIYNSSSRSSSGNVHHTCIIASLWKRLYEVLVLLPSVMQEFHFPGLQHPHALLSSWYIYICIIIWWHQPMGLQLLGILPNTDPLFGCDYTEHFCILSTLQTDALLNVVNSSSNMDTSF